MKCTRCKKPAYIKLESHNAKFCDDCFDIFFLNSVRKALKIFGIDQKQKICVAVSGGKDSLVAWDVLHRLGYTTIGLHLDLGIPDFSEASVRAVEEFTASRGLDGRTVSLRELFGYDLPDLYKRTRQDICSLCGILKRSFLNRLAGEAGCLLLATGHHLDDEAGRLMGNLIRHKERYLEKFYPCLPPAEPGQAGRFKPLYRLDETEIKAYVKIQGIKPAEGPGCQFAKGATSHYFKEALNLLEEKMPGTKRDFLFTYLKDKSPPQEETFVACSICGQPTYGELCAVCRLKEKLKPKGAGRTTL